MSAQLANPPSYPQRPAPTAPSATAAPPTSRDHQQYHHLFPPAHSQSLQHNHPHPLLQSPPDQDAAQSDSGELEFDDQLLHQPATAVTAINTTAPIPRPVTATTVSRFSRDDGTPTPTARRGSFSSFFRRSSSRSRSATLEADAPPPSRGVSVDQQRSKGPPPSAGAYYANGSVAPTNKYTSAEPLPADYAERITRSSHDQQSQYLATAAHLKQQARPAHSPSASESYPQPPPSRTSFSSTRHHRVATAPTDANNLTATSAALHQGTRLRKNSFGNGIRSSNTLPSRSNSGAAEISNSKSNTNTASGNASSTSSRMLRKSSRKQRELLLEQERQAREAHANRLAPHISLNPLPNIASFAGEIDQQHYYHHDSSTTSSAAAATTNFSRPGAMSSSGGYVSSSPAYALSSRADPGSSPPTSNGEPSVAGDRTESMRNRGRYSYASSITPANASSPRRVRRRKDPTPFNVLVIGAKNSGKTSFISFLRHSLALPAHKRATEAPTPPPASSTSTSFSSHYLETEIDGERVGLTLWDSVGLEQNIVDLQLREMTAFVEAKFEDTFVEEQKVMRSPGVRDTHIHCVFLVLDPVRLDTSLGAGAKSNGAGKSGSGLDRDVDLHAMRALWGKTTVIPVIAKADTLTSGHMAYLKRAVWQSLRKSRLDPLEALELEDDDEDDEDEDDNEEELVGASKNPDVDSDAEGESLDRFPPSRNGSGKKSNSHKRQSSLSALHGSITHGSEDDLPYLPLSILSPDPYDLPPFAKPSATGKIGRRFPWGFADPYDPTHCDFGRLRDSIFSEWRADLRELSRTKWYENWRTSRLKVGAHHTATATASSSAGINTATAARKTSAPNLVQHHAAAPASPPQAHRLPGGVTPLAAVPREGRSVSGGQPAAAAATYINPGPSVSAPSLAAAAPPPSQQPPPPPPPAVSVADANAFVQQQQAATCYPAAVGPPPSGPPPAPPAAVAAGARRVVR